MRHEVSDYTDSDLKAAIRSPYQPQQFKEECEAELTSRKYKFEKQFEHIRVHNLK